MPPIGLITGKIDFANHFVVLDESKGIPKTLAEAKTMSVPVIAYGQFINDIISFLIVAFVSFLIVKRVNRLWSDEPAREHRTRARAARTGPACGRRTARTRRGPRCR